MARISSNTWREARKDFEAGMSQADIRKKYDLGTGALGNKIKRDGWRLSQEQTAILAEFKEASVKISESFHNANETQQKEMSERAVTILEDNELIGNNRKLLKSFQGLIGRGIKDGIYVKAKDIKAGVSAIRDIEAISNPTAKSPQVNIQNNNANTQHNIDNLHQTGIAIGFLSEED